VGFENRWRELLPILSSDQPFASDVKQERVVVVEFIQCTALFSCYDTIACMCVHVCVFSCTCMSVLCVCVVHVLCYVCMCVVEMGKGETRWSRIEIGQLYE